MLLIEDQATRISNIELNQFMDKYNLKLPTSYIDFILINNGGYPNLSIYMNKQNEEFEIESFFRVNRDKDILEDDLDYDILSARNIIETHQIIEKNIPKSFYPFANSPENHIFCISLNENDYGTIHIYALDGRIPAQNFVAPSFKTLINNLKKNNDG